MLSIAGMAEVAALVGDPARANMLAALMDGRALAAGELARAAGVTPQTASTHLARLTAAGLLALERQGRHRYHRLASPMVAQMLEGMMGVASAARAEGHPRRAKLIAAGPRDRALRLVRTCYDHLAGQLAVALADRMVERGHIEFSADGGAVTPAGAIFLHDLGIDLDVPGAQARPRRKRMFCRPCLDWSERRPHIAGAVGAAFCSACLAHGWLRRTEGSRALTVTPAGRIALIKAFGSGILD